MEYKEAAIRLKQFEEDIGKYLNEAAQALNAQKKMLDALQNALDTHRQTLDTHRQTFDAQQLLFAAAAQQADVHVNALRQFLKEQRIAPPN